MNWYEDEAQFRARLAESGSMTQLSTTSGVARTTLYHWHKKHGIGEETLPPEAAAIQRELDLARLENKRLRRHATERALGDLEVERVLQRIDEAVSTQRPSWKAREFTLPSEHRSAQEVVLMWSDLHASEVVSSESTRGINSYSWEVMVDRMAQAQDSIFSHVEHFAFPVEQFTIWMLGDMLSGDIHDELAITNDRPTVEAVVDLAYEHLPWLLAFAEYFPKVHISAVCGNHPRRTKKPSFKEYHSNADWLFYKTLEALLRGNPQFTFDIPRSAMSVTQVAKNWRALLMHGDGIRTTMPGVPWGGVIRRITTLEAQFTQARQPLDYVAMGHWHTRNALDGVHAETFVNGSVKGADEYGLQNFGSGRAAAQTLLSFHPERGNTGVYPLQLQTRVPASEGWS